MKKKGETIIWVFIGVLFLICIGIIVYMGTVDKCSEKIEPQVKYTSCVHGCSFMSHVVFDELMENYFNECIMECMKEYQPDLYIEKYLKAKIK